MATHISAGLGDAQAKAAETARQERVQGGHPDLSSSGDPNVSGDQPGSPEAAAKDLAAGHTGGDTQRSKGKKGDPDNDSETTGATESGEEYIGAKA